MLDFFTEGISRKAAIVPSWSYHRFAACRFKPICQLVEPLITSPCAAVSQNCIKLQHFRLSVVGHVLDRAKHLRRLQDLVNSVWRWKESCMGGRLSDWTARQNYVRGRRQHPRDRSSPGPVTMYCMYCTMRAGGDLHVDQRLSGEQASFSVKFMLYTFVELHRQANILMFFFHSRPSAAEAYVQDRTSESSNV